MLSASMLERHPLFACAFRPLFLATALYGVGGLLLGVAAMAYGIVPTANPGGVLLWHVHELMFGFGLAAIAGFVLTAVPEFTGTPPFGPRTAVAVTLWWLVARVAFWFSGAIGPWPAALSNVGLALLLPALLGARLMREHDRKHAAFFWGLTAFAIVTAGFHVDVLLGAWPMRWAYAAIDVMMILIVVAMSRVSMRIVNDALDAVRTSATDDVPEYRARPPRRNLAIFAIAAFAATEFIAPDSAVSGWIALAAAAAVLNLLNDWHVGRALLGRWPLMLYAVYWLMAAGYAAIGVALLDGGFGTGAGRHLLAVGAMGLSIFAVLSIAGRIHGGRPLDRRAWTPIGAALLVFAAAARAAAGVPGAPGPFLVTLASLGWAASFGLVAGYLGPVWWSARIDAGHGCEEWVDPDSQGDRDSRRSTSSSSTCGNRS